MLLKLYLRTDTTGGINVTSQQVGKMIHWGGLTLSGNAIETTGPQTVLVFIDILVCAAPLTETCSSRGKLKRRNCLQRCGCGVTV